MQLIPVEKIVTVSGEHPDHKVFSLITGFGSWTTEKVGEEKAEIVLKLAELAQITRIEIANESSAWVDIRVAREGVPDVPLLPTLCLQTRKDSKENTNCRAQRALETTNFNGDVRAEKFDYVKIICRQPFNRDVRFGLSQLKFFTQPTETKAKNAHKSSSTVESEDVVLNIVGDKSTDDSNKLIGAIIKTASYRDVDRAKRVVTTSPFDGDAEDPTDDLRPKATPSIIRNSFNPSGSKTSTPIPSKNSFVFAPAASAADQENQAKKAAAEAEQIIPGGSPKKSKLSYKTAQAIYTPVNGKSNERRQASEDGPSGEASLSFLRKTLASWQANKSAERNDQTPRARPVRSPAISPASPEQKRRRLEEDPERRRVPPPRIQRIDDLLGQSPSAGAKRTKTKRSVVHGSRERGIISPFVVKINTKAKQQKITSLMDRIFSSSDTDGETMDSSERNKTKNQSKDVSSEVSTLRIEDSNLTPIIKPEVEEITSDEEIVVKTESTYNESPSQVVDISDDVVEPEKRERPSVKKKVNRNPPVNCEVESDSDLEVVGNDLMKGVVFALSGFKNPYRSSLRSMAISMGARYRPDWDDTCTHLICAFKNTPKYREVLQKNGKIVTAAWIATSHIKQKLADWKNYRLL